MGKPRIFRRGSARSLLVSHKRLGHSCPRDTPLTGGKLHEARLAMGPGAPSAHELKPEPIFLYG